MLDETSSILAARRLPFGAWQLTAGNQTPPSGKTGSSHLNAEMEQSKSLTAPSPMTKQSLDLVWRKGQLTCTEGRSRAPRGGSEQSSRGGRTGKEVEEGAALARKEEEKGATPARDAKSTSLLPSSSRFEVRDPHVLEERGGGGLYSPSTQDSSHPQGAAPPRKEEAAAQATR